MTHAKRVLTLLLSGALLCAAAPARAVVQEYQTLELVRTYNTEEEVQAAYPDLFPPKLIEDTGNHINFLDPQTKQPLKQLSKQPSQILREELTENDTIIWERTYQYQISEDQAFLVETEWEGGRLKSGSADPADLRGEPVKRTLYNTKGEVVTQLLSDMNFVQLSPNKQYFYAWTVDEIPPLEFYLYAIDGTLLHTIDFQGYDRASFSQNGAFIELISGGRDFTILSKTGEVVYKGNCAELLKDQSPVFYGVFASDDGASFLMMTTNKQMHLFSMDGKLLWSAPSSEVLRVYFDSEKRLLELIELCDRLSQIGKEDDY